MNGTVLNAIAANDSQIWTLKAGPHAGKQYRPHYLKVSTPNGVYYLRANRQPDSPTWPSGAQISFQFKNDPRTGQPRQFEINTPEGKATQYDIYDVQMIQENGPAFSNGSAPSHPPATSQSSASSSSHNPTTQTGSDSGPSYVSELFDVDRFLAQIFFDQYRAIFPDSVSDDVVANIAAEKATGVRIDIGYNRYSLDAVKAVVAAELTKASASSDSDGDLSFRMPPTDIAAADSVITGNEPSDLDPAADDDIPF